MMIDTTEDVAAAKQVLEGWWIPNCRERWFKLVEGFYYLSNHWCEVYFWE